MCKLHQSLHQTELQGDPRLLGDLFTLLTMDKYSHLGFCFVSLCCFFLKQLMAQDLWCCIWNGNLTRAGNPQAQGPVTWVLSTDHCQFLTCYHRSEDSLLCPLNFRVCQSLLVHPCQWINIQGTCICLLQFLIITQKGRL